jgi:hypothetical protein
MELTRNYSHRVLQDIDVFTPESARTNAPMMAAPKGRSRQSLSAHRLLTRDPAFAEKPPWLSINGGRTSKE